jgi:hypothetical protein
MADTLLQVGCERMTTIDGIPLCVASGGSMRILQTIFSVSRRHLAVIGTEDSSWRVLTFVRETPAAAKPFWAEIGSPSTADSLQRAEVLARDNLRSIGADL